MDHIVTRKACKIHDDYRAIILLLSKCGSDCVLKCCHLLFIYSKRQFVDECTWQITSYPKMLCWYRLNYHKTHLRWTIADEIKHLVFKHFCLYTAVNVKVISSTNFLTYHDEQSHMICQQLLLDRCHKHALTSHWHWVLSWHRFCFVTEIICFYLSTLDLDSCCTYQKRCNQDSVEICYESAIMNLYSFQIPSQIISKMSFFLVFVFVNQGPTCNWCKLVCRVFSGFFFKLLPFKLLRTFRWD